MAKRHRQKKIKKSDRALTFLAVIVLLAVIGAIAALVFAPPRQEGCYWLTAVCDDGLHEMECVAGHQIDPAGHIAILPDGQRVTVRAMVYLKFCGDKFYGNWKRAWHLVGEECRVVTGRPCEVEQ